MLIGLLGKKRVGKDTVAEYLIKKYNFIRYAFADPIKEIAKIMFNFSDEQLYGNQKEIIDPRWGISPRNFFQKFGTEMTQYDIYKHFPQLREKIPPREMWVVIFQEWYRKKVEENPNIRVVISDVRFIHELNRIKELDGIIIRIIRPDIELKNQNETHLSEIENQDVVFDMIDFTIINNSEIKSYHNKIDKIMKYFL